MHIESEKNKGEKIEMKKITEEMTDPRTKEVFFLEMVFDEKGHMNEIYRKNIQGKIVRYINLKKMKNLEEKRDELQMLGIPEKSIAYFLQSDGLNLESKK